MTTATELTGAELNAAIAERVMGFKWTRLNRRDTVVYLTAQEVRYPEQKGDERLLDTANSYSSDIAAAMSVQDRISELGLEAKYAMLLAESTPHWEFASEQATWWHIASATAEQRCRAALATVDGGKP